MRNRYPKKNPGGATIGLAIAGVGLLGGIGYLLYKNSAAATTPTAPATPTVGASSVLNNPTNAFGMLNPTMSAASAGAIQANNSTAVLHALEPWQPSTSAPIVEDELPGVGY